VLTMVLLAVLCMLQVEITLAFTAYPFSGGYRDIHKQF
jgi:hypothetical protein